MKTLVRAIFLTLVAAIAHAEPMSFALRGNGGNCNGCEWIAAEGEITTDTPDVFRAFMADHGRLHLYQAVTFDSPGGNLGAAIELGRLLRAAQASTSIGRTRPMVDFPQHHEGIPGGRCDSACGFAFLGGETRHAFDEELGIHRFDTPDGQEIPSAATQKIMGQIVLYLIEMGISTELLALASKVPAHEMHRLSVDELDRLNVATTARTTPLSLQVANGGLEASWDQTGLNGKLELTANIRCSRSNNAWIVRARHHSIASDVWPSPKSPDDSMELTVGHEKLDLSPDNILWLVRDEDDFVIETILPIDLRDHANKTIALRPYTGWRHWLNVLFVGNKLPDAATLDAMVRACGD
ncbi:MAG: hypothetical protein CMF72_06040 [Mameliella sp.]|nr:hypothetical protein [Mameliella sp.]|tara:strand:+ start:129 stop:1187 length:1059 start_codon:yes stop_codon:yes gene_type:complete